MSEQKLRLRLPTFLPTQQRFRQMVFTGIKGDPKAIPVVAYFGGWGSGKTTILKWLVMEYLTRFPGIAVLVCRETYTALSLTTMPEFLSKLDEGNGENQALIFKAGWNEKKATYRHVSGSTVTFGGLDKVEKWGSTQYGLICIDEGSLCSEGDLTFLLSRIRQPAPACKHCKAKGCSRCGSTGNTWGDGYRRAVCVFSNHVYENHWLYRDFVGGQIDPMGRAEDARAKDGYSYVEATSWENSPAKGGYLPQGYLERLISSVDEHTVSVFVNGKWGIRPEGTPVYRFIPEIQGNPWHLRETKFDAARPLYRSLDFGYRFPFCTWHQYQARGRLRTLAEFTLPGSHTEDFLRAALAFESELFPDCGVSATYGDPAGMGERSEGPNDAMTVERVFGTQMRSIPSTKDTKRGRRKVMGEWLGRTIDNEPAYAIDAKRCPQLKLALMGMYRYPKLKRTFEHTNYLEEPVEEHPFVDVVHSVEYFFANQYQREVVRSVGSQMLKVRTPSYRWGG